MGEVKHLHNKNNTRIVIVSGLSGSGKSVALHRLEDIGYFTTDNIPAAMIEDLLNLLLGSNEERNQYIAIGLDARNKRSELSAVPDIIKSLKQSGIHTDLLYLTTDKEIILKRYSETRRRHPLSSEQHSLEDAVELEQSLLAPIRDAADITFDTTNTNVHELRELVAKRIHSRLPETLSLQFKSFGFKHGTPTDADYIFDVRCLPNPYWEPSLRQFSGLDPEIQEYLGSQELVQNMILDITNFLTPWIPEFKKNNRSYLTIAIGCTGGQHRSVYITEQLGKHFSEKYAQVLVRHNELKMQLDFDAHTKEPFLAL